MLKLDPCISSRVRPEQAARVGRPAIEHRVAPRRHGGLVVRPGPGGGCAPILAGVSHGVIPFADGFGQRSCCRQLPALVITAWWKYWVFMGLYYAFDYHRRFREREVAAAI